MIEEFKNITCPDYTPKSCGNCGHCDVRYGEDSGCALKQVKVSVEALEDNKYCIDWKTQSFKDN